MTPLCQLIFRYLKAAITVLYHDVLIIKEHHIMLYVIENTGRASLLTIKVKCDMLAFISSIDYS